MKTLLQNVPILNRTGKLPDDGWHQFEVPGEHINHAAKVVQVIDDKAITSILNRFAADAKAQGESFPGLLIDQDHFSLDTSKASVAMGWGLELRNRDGIPEARIDWSTTGRAKVEGKDYKFFSTVYDPADCEVIGDRIVNKKKYQLVRPLRLDRLALTNDPNNRGGKPISNRNGNPADATDENKPTMKSVLKLLGLAEDASEESAVAALKLIQNRASSVEALTKERDELLAVQVEADLDAHKAVIKNRESWKTRLLADRKGTLAILADITAGGDTKGRETITNRGNAKPPAGGGGEDAAAQAAEVRATKISNRARALRTQNPKVTLNESYSTAEAEIDAEAAK